MDIIETYDNSDDNVTDYTYTYDSGSFSIERFVVELNNGKLTCYGFIEHNELCVYLILTAIYQQLLTISDINKDIDSTETKKQSSFDSKLTAMKQLFQTIYLSDICISHRCLQLFSDIITLCENKLERINIEFKLSTKGNSHDKVKQSINNVSSKLVSIYQQTFGSVTNLNDDENKIDEKSVESVFNIMMSKMSQLKQLINFTVDIHQFPSNCYDYYKYFKVNNNVISFEYLKSFRFQLGHIEMVPYIEQIKHNLYEWIVHHSNLNDIEIKTKNYAQSFGKFDEQIDITYKQRNDMKLLIIKFIEGIIKNTGLCERMKCFSIYDELMGIRDYKDILIKLFDCKLLNITNLTLAFNDMRDVYIKDIIDSIIKSNYICNNLCVLGFEWINTYTQYIAYDLYPDALHWIQARPDFFALNNDKNIETYFEYKIYECMPSVLTLTTSSDSIQRFRDIHYAQNSILSLINLIKKCRFLDSLEISYFDGIDTDHTKQLIDILIHHGNIDDLTLYGLRSNDSVCNSLTNLFLQKYSFIENLKIMFSDNTNFKRTLTNQCLENMISTFMKSTLYEECIESVTNTLFHDIGFIMDVVKIIIIYMFDEGKPIIKIEIGGLQNSLKKNSKQHFDKLKSTVSSQRDIRYNDDLCWFIDSDSDS